MNKTIKGLMVVSTFMSILCASSFSSAADEAYDWFEDADGYEEVLALAEEEKKPLIVYFHVEWCGYCKHLNEEFLDDYIVDAFLESYLRVKINPDNGEEETAITQKHRVNGYPTFLVTHPSTKKVRRVHPFREGGEIWSIDRFMDEIEKAAKDISK